MFWILTPYQVCNFSFLFKITGKDPIYDCDNNTDFSP